MAHSNVTTCVLAPVSFRHKNIIFFPLRLPSQYVTQVNRLCVPGHILYTYKFQFIMHSYIARLLLSVQIGFMKNLEKSIEILCTACDPSGS